MGADGRYGKPDRQSRDEWLRSLVRFAGTGRSTLNLHINLLE
jgi:hypothetical protein